MTDTKAEVTHVCVGPGTGDVRFQAAYTPGDRAFVTTGPLFESQGEALGHMATLAARNTNGYHWQVIQKCRRDWQGEDIWGHCDGGESMKPPEPAPRTRGRSDVHMGKPPAAVERAEEG